MGCGASTKKKQSAKLVSAPAAAVQRCYEQAAGNVKINVGPLELNKDGIAMKPKFNLGITGPRVYMMAGVRDVRDGLAVEGFSMMHKDYSSKGSTLVEVLQNIKAVDPVPGLDDLITVMPEAVAAVLSEFHIDIAVAGLEAEGVVFVFVGIGITAGLYLGWLDTKGYAMVGVEGQCATATAISLSLRAGLHESGRAVRVVMWLGNVGYDAVVRLKTPHIREPSAVPIEIPGTTVADVPPECNSMPA